MSKCRLGPDMNIRQIVDFLKDIPPFYKIAEEGLENIAKTLVAEQFSSAEFIIKEGVHGLNFYIIVSGLAKAYRLDAEGTEDILAFVGEGDCFGEISLLTNKPTTANIQAAENTTCLVQTKEQFLLMTEQYPAVMEFLRQLMSNRLKTSYREALSRESGVIHVEPYIYTKQVKDMIPPLGRFMNEKETIRDAARELLGAKAGSQLVTDDHGNHRGIISVNTILKSMIFGHVSPEEAIGKIVEKKYSTIGGDGYFFDALHRMIKNETNVLVVTDGDRAVGVLTESDLLRFRGREALSLLRNIDGAGDFTQLNAMRKEIEKVLREIMLDGALASQACGIISEFNDRIVRKVIQFAEAECGVPPCAYAWLGLGSEGRREQTYFTDQDNAIIIEHSHGSAGEYFKGFSKVVVMGLNMCGIPLCKGGVMATNPKFAGSLAEWKERLARWILGGGLDEKELMNVYVFLDFRSLHGEQSFGRELRNHIAGLIRENRSFLAFLAGPVVSIPPPIGFFRNFIVARSGEHKDRLNLKLYGLVPLLTCMKILALRYELAETSTLERIHGLKRLDAITSDQEELFVQAFETFLTLKIRNNLVDCDQAKAFGNFMKPADLSTRQKQLLKEAFWAVSEVQKITRHVLRIGGLGTGITN